MTTDRNLNVCLASHRGGASAEVRRSRIISHPTNFAHVAHIGPEQTKPTLVDLTTVSILFLQSLQNS